MLGNHALADPGGAAGTCPPPQQDQFLFIFTYVFAEKCMRRRLVPPNGSVPPQREILDPPLPWTCKSINLSLMFKVFTDIHARHSLTYKSINLGPVNV